MRCGRDSHVKHQRAGKRGQRQTAEHQRLEHVPGHHPIVPAVEDPPDPGELHEPYWKLDEHFAKSPLAGTVGPMFFVVTLLELSAGALSGIGCLLLLITRNATVAFFGAVVAAINLVALFFGQRLSKDYAGAAALVPYFLLALTAIYLLAEH